MSVRPAEVAGSFYPGNATELKNYLDQLISFEEKRRSHTISPKHIIGGIVPHAGYKYAAKEAIHFFKFLKKYNTPVDTFVIINPSHTGAKYEISLDTHEAWKTPLGNVQLDVDLMDFLNLPRSVDAQQGEHSAEVIIPYLQYFLDYDFKIVPITMRKQNYKNARMLAEKLYKANEVKKKKIALIASTDFSHYEKPELAFYNDNLVINRILENSIRGLYDTIRENKISVCGYGPIMTLMFYSRMVQTNYKVEILARGNSSQRSDNDEELVVDYVSALFYN
jgi:AmmeMemoRadiSam system protein B